MSIKLLSVRYFLAAFLLVLVATASAFGAAERYDLVYIWDKDIESVLDYKDQLEELFDDDVSNRLKIVGKGDEYGVIYDTNGSARDVMQEFARHGEILRKAGLKEAWAIKDEGYHRLYNVSYGLGPHRDSLKKTYDLIYKYLGKDVGKNLYIEKTNANNYTLIYRKRGDRIETMEIATAHAKLLKKLKIRTSITPENNNEIVYGESSLLNDSGETLVASDEGAKDGQAEESSVEAASNDATNSEETSTSAAANENTPEEIVVLTKSTVKNIVAAKKGKADKRASELAGENSATSFERNVEQLIKRLRSSGKIRSDEKTGWMVYDLENDRNLVNINANQVFQAASMIKPFVALAYFHQVKRGKLKYGSKSRQMMEAMIQRSSNTATNWVMRQVGGPAACEKILLANYRHIFKNTNIQEYIPAGGRTYRNSALPSDYIRFLRALWNNELPYDKEIRRIMALPGRDRLYHGTAIPQGTLVYNKTGSTGHLIGDMGILVPKTKKGNRHPYAIVGIIERSSKATDYGNWMMARGNVIRQVSTMVYQEMKKKYQLL
ncbi:serine hydrolase [Desulfopila aestuarii]|uniref:beta-lactamase n=1 Tax=Desulfopila aestuarii DSM 18488 TaxID=1121416 RepID=A0A1M7Y1B7_9BACT|nr:serine hydrolase [Desulfopila aestuarii]SHO45576.1 beta-lactamase class A [Desulfopila aestuarii DSM 18488]